MPKIPVNRQTSTTIPSDGVTPLPGNDAPTPRGTSVDVMEPVLHVCWRNSAEGAGHVQHMATVDVAHVQQLLAEAEQQNSSRVEVWFPTLIRRETNDHITALRKARDQAMGADA